MGHQAATSKKPGLSLLKVAWQNSREFLGWNHGNADNFLENYF